MVAMRGNTTMFAAYVPLSVAANFFTSPTDASVAAGRPTWYFTGFSDGSAGGTEYRDRTRQSYNYQLRAAGYSGANLPTFPTAAANYTHSSPDGLYHYTEYASGGHNNVVWNNGAYNDAGMYTWLD